MRLIKDLVKFMFKIIVIPIKILLSVSVSFLQFIFGLSEMIFATISVIVAGGGIIMLFTGYSTYISIGIIIIGFLVSPLGLLKIVEWFIDLLGNVNYSLKDFIMS